jgi:CheY-like chemotaxis protein
MTPPPPPPPVAPHAHVILIVEDEEELREILRDALELSGFLVVAASEGQEALAALAKNPHVCVVLLDLLMPGMNGWEFLKAMRANAAFDGIPVVVTSSAPSRAPPGVTQVLRKPLQLNQVLRTVHEFCGST